MFREMLRLLAAVNARRREDVAIHRGPYDGLPATFQAVEAWVREEGRSPGGPPMEIYLTDPGEHPDPATWETQVVLPVT